MAEWAGQSAALHTATHGEAVPTGDKGGTMVLSGPDFVLERRVNRPSNALARTLRDRETVAPAVGFPLGDGATLLVDETLRPWPDPMVPGHDSWRTTGRLLTSRGRLFVRLDIEIATWARDSVTVQLRPLGRSPQRWGARRTRRYFTLAHAGADQIEHLLNDAAATEGCDVATRDDAPDPTSLTIRPIEPHDAEELRDLFWMLSPESRYFRFLSPVNQPREGCLRHLAEVDHRDRDALVASVDSHVVAVARYDRSVTEPRTAEVAVVVADAWHRRGIATALLRALTGVATERGVEHFTATIAAENRAVATLVRSLPVDATWNWEGGQRHLDVDLSRPARATGSGSSSPIEP